jgi:hypothetical protein
VCSDQLVCHDFWSVARMPPTSWWPVVTATLVILPEVAVTEMPLFGLASWYAVGRGDGHLGGRRGGRGACRCSGLPAALEPAGLVQAAANRETMPNTAMMPSPTRRVDGRLC